jgi:hypothetical protein
MGIRTAFVKGVETIFKVLKDAVKVGTYISVVDDGWDSKTETAYTVRVIPDNFTQADIEKSSFSKLIQPTDVKGLVPGVDLTVTIKTSDSFKVEDVRYEIVAYETDPLEVLHTLLLRNTA